MLVSPDRRVCLSDRSPVAAPPELEAVFVGAAAENPAFKAAGDALAAAARLGFVPADGDRSLTGLPLAVSSAAAFAAAFPGDDTWLARSVRDYFNAGGQRAWVVRVAADPAMPVNAYMPRVPAKAPSQPPTSIDIALQIPSAGLLALPDLEYLCLATELPPPAVPAPPPAPPGFRPARDFVVTPPPAVPPAPPAPPATATVTPRDVLRRVSAALSARRPDMLCLFALPVGAEAGLSMPALVARTAAFVRGDGGSGEDLPQIQAFAPLLRDAAGQVASPTGMIAGMLCATAQREGVWRSIAGRPLPLAPTPLRRIESSALAKLRHAGIAVLRFGPGGTTLDDDILALCGTGANAARRAAGTRRLMGWLVRNLARFGEDLVFENILDDARVELVLDDLFGTLLRRGALSGSQISDAVSITRRVEGEGGVSFEIAVAIATALETIRLRFLDGELTASFGEAA